MQLFSRNAVLAGDPTAAMGWAVKIGEYVTQKSGRQITTWAGQFGVPLGTVVWSTFVEGLADFQNTFAGLVADPGYLAMIAEGAAYQSGPLTDNLSEVVVGGPTAGGERPPIGAVTTVTTAVCNAARIMDAMAWGAELATYIGGVTGQISAFLSQMQGPFGGVSWINGAPDAASADAAGAKINTDPGFMQRVGGLSDLFVPATGTRYTLVRIG
jgi:hypothetical protein